MSGGYVAIMAAEQTDAKTVIVIAPDYEYGRMQTTSFVNRLNELRPDMTVQEIYAPLFAPDFTPTLRKSSTEAGCPHCAVGGDYITILKQLVNFNAFGRSISR
jgi:hypothetical protein